MPHSRSDAGSKVTLPITPMLDMTFQLLFFFIINFHPADLEGQMDMALPAEGREPGVTIGRAPGALPEFARPDWTVLVRAGIADREGEITSIIVRNPTGREEPVGDLPGLRQFFADKGEAIADSSMLKVAGTGNLKVANLLQVVDTCRQAGFTTVSLGTISNQ